jgi:hypothetical protein
MRDAAPIIIMTPASAAKTSGIVSIVTAIRRNKSHSNDGVTVWRRMNDSCDEEEDTIKEIIGRREKELILIQCDHTG